MASVTVTKKDQDDPSDTLILQSDDGRTERSFPDGVKVDDVPDSILEKARAGVEGWEIKVGGKAVGDKAS